MTVRYAEKNAWSILFQLYGSIWLRVLPYCILNCCLTGIIIYCQTKHYNVSFSPQGHGFIGLLVSFLVLNKLYLAVDRYMTIRSLIGHTFLSIRELNQLVLIFTTPININTTNNNNNNNKTTTSTSSSTIAQRHKQWCNTIRETIFDLLESTVEVLQDDTKACYLWRNERYKPTTGSSSSWFWNSSSNGNQPPKILTTSSDGNGDVVDLNNDYDDVDSEEFDPLYHALILRRDIYSYNETVLQTTTTTTTITNDIPAVTTTADTNIKTTMASTRHIVTTPLSSTNNSGKRLELLERMKLLDLIAIACTSYRDLLGIVATPLPFPMIQMGRTFVFLWIFTMPCALVGLQIELVATISFIFFITYGYIGLELVSMKLLHPFGDDVNDLNILGILTATELAIEKDSDAILMMTNNNNTTPPTLNGISYKNGNNQTNNSRPSSSTRGRKSISPLKHRRPGINKNNQPVPTLLFSGDEDDVDNVYLPLNETGVRATAAAATTTTSIGITLGGAQLVDNDHNNYNDDNNNNNYNNHNNNNDHNFNHDSGTSLMI